MEEKIKRVRDRIRRNIEYMENMRQKSDDYSGYVVWLIVTLVPGLLRDMEIDDLEPYWEEINDRLGQVLENHTKFLKLKEILGIDTK